MYLRNAKGAAAPSGLNSPSGYFAFLAFFGFGSGVNGAGGVESIRRSTSSVLGAFSARFAAFMVKA